MALFARGDLYFFGLIYQVVIRTVDDLLRVLQLVVVNSEGW
jgi:hypothetical protein